VVVGVGVWVGVGLGVGVGFSVGMGMGVGVGGIVVVIKRMFLVKIVSQKSMAELTRISFATPTRS
jgi:hypothetical protein